MWYRIFWLYILFLLGRHLCFPASPRYLELADSADFFIERQNWNKAEDKIIEALRLEPANFSNSLLLANLGLVQTQKKEYAKAIESLSLGLNIAPSSTVLLNNRAHTFLLIDSLNSAVRDLDKSLSIDSIQEWTLRTRAFIHLQNQEFEQAKKLFYKILEFNPDNFSVYSGLAAIAEYNGKLEDAEFFYKKVIDNLPEDEEARQAYIMLLIKKNEYSLARSQIKEGLAINPENPMFYLLRGYLHRLNFRYDEAIADKKTAIAKGLDPQFVANFIP